MRLQMTQFADWRLQIAVSSTNRFAFADELRAMPSRTQIPGMIAWKAERDREWTGRAARLSADAGALKPNAKYLLFRGDNLGGAPDETGCTMRASISSILSPETINGLRHERPDASCGHGPHALRVERPARLQKGEYVMRIERWRNSEIGSARRLWEDRGYEWYAGFDLFKRFRRSGVYNARPC